jgi:hypothetical protein
MAGRPRKPTTTDKRGGKRANTGPKPKEKLTKHQVDAMLSKAEEYAKEYGKTIDEIILDFVYGLIDKITVRDRLAAIDMFKKYSMAKRTEKEIDVNKRIIGPAIALPPLRTDPAKIIPIDGGKK